VVDLEKGRLEEAASEALTLARRAGYPSGAAAALRTLALVHLAYGRLVEADEVLVEARSWPRAGAATPPRPPACWSGARPRIPTSATASARP
jgi:hypothetical protein